MGQIGFWVLPPICIALFAALMAFRAELQSIWPRALIAGLAFGILGFMIYALRQKHSHNTRNPSH
jgi:hypothetical protein